MRGRLYGGGGTKEVALQALVLGEGERRVLVGKPAPDFEAIDVLTGRPVYLSEFRGKVVLLEFWGYWCTPCIYQMKELLRLHELFADAPLAIVALHDSSVADRAEFDGYTDRMRHACWGGRKLPFTVLLDRPDSDERNRKEVSESTGATIRRYHVRSFPTLFLIDQDGLVAAEVSRRDEVPVEEKIRALLSRKK